MKFSIPCTVSALSAPGPNEAVFHLKPTNSDEPAGISLHTTDPKVLAELRLGLKLIVNVQTAGAA